MINIEDKTKCCGCTACANICPKNCIKMVEDEEGFVYPKVNKAKCIECNLCEKVCPILNKIIENKKSPEAFVIRSKDINTVMNSTSGGFVTPLFKWIIENNGIVCTATYDNEFRIIHKIYNQIDSFEYRKIRGSKYVQSNLGDCFKKLEEYLKKEKQVCFIGTTCQVYGLKKFLRKDYNNLILIDLVCHGVTSPKLWNKYMDYQKKKYKSDILDISFRNKTYGYHSSTMKIEFKNKKVYYGSARIDFMLKSFFQEIASRPACYECKFKGVNRVSDFTVYDCWHASELVEGLNDDDKGYTNLTVHSKNGINILSEIKELYNLYPVDLERAVLKDGKMIQKSAIPHPMRKSFYEYLENKNIAECIDKFIPIRKKDYIFEGLKRSVYKIGLYNKIKKIVK